MSACSFVLRFTSQPPTDAVIPPGHWKLFKMAVDLAQSGTLTPLNENEKEMVKAIAMDSEPISTKQAWHVLITRGWHLGQSTHDYGDPLVIINWSRGEEMKRKLGLGLFVVLALIAGIVLGHELRRYFEPTDKQIVDAMMRQMPEVGLLMGTDLQPAETAFDDWFYPDAEKLESSSSMSGSKNGHPFEFFTAAEMRSSDSFETVVEHYSAKLRTVLPLGDDDDWTLSPDGSGSAGFNGVLLSYRMGNKWRGRPVQIGNIGLLAKNCNLHLSITRGDGENHTYISVWFSKWPVE